MMEKCKSDTKKLYCNGKDMQRYQAAEHANLTSPANTKSRKNRGTATAVRNRESSRCEQNHARKYVSDLG